MTILFAGKKGFEYNRTKVLIAGLKQLKGVTVLEYEFGTKNESIARELIKRSAEADFVMVPSFRHSDVKFVKKYTQKPIVFDPLISNYLTKVVDYGHYWKAPVKYVSDFFPMRRSDVLIADTEQHKHYFHRIFRVPQEKIHVVPVGVNTSKFTPQDMPVSDKYRVGFYGSFNPLQGVEKIIDVANLLRDEKNITFEIIGDGTTFSKVEKRKESYGLSNINFLRWLPYDQLNQEINKFDLCLGIFGNSLKSDMVVPNKIFHYAALGKPIITKDTLAIRDAFRFDSEIVLTSNSPEDIAAKILELKGSSEKSEAIGAAALSRIHKEYHEVAVAERLVKALEG